MKITQSELKSIMRYIPSTGKFIWIRPTSNSIKPGDKAGTITSRDKYVRIIINGVHYSGHSLAWLYMKGEYPKKQIDHIDHIRWNNKWKNLREVSHLDNHRNKTISKANKSGTVGVTWDTKNLRWCACIGVEGKKHHLGNFKDKNEAIDARIKAERKFGFHSNHGKDPAEQQRSAAYEF